MDMLLELIANYGLLVAVVAVFLDQGGLPIPAYPPLIVASAMAFDADESVLPILAVATVAAVAADALWFAGGRRFGVRLLRFMCRLSLSPDSCVMSTRDRYSRWGPASLIGAKFIPGFAAVATTLAGENRTPFLRFVFFDAVGAFLWAGLAIALGVIFHAAVNDVLLRLEDLGHVGLWLVLAAIGAFIAWKWWQRQRFLKEIRMARITVPELYQLIEEGKGPLIFDVRTVEQRAGGWIPGAMFVANPSDAPPASQEEVIVYCDCPSEASAAILARELKRRGFVRVRPLAGGFLAWQAEGYAIDRDA